MVFFKKDEKETNDITRLINAGGTDIIGQIFLFLDHQSLSRLARTSKELNQIVNTLAKNQIQIRIAGKEFTGTYSQICQKYNQLKEMAEKYKEMSNARREEIKDIRKHKEAIRAAEVARQQKHSTYMTSNEKAATAFCCFVGCIGGLMFSCFTPFSCLWTSPLGAAAGGTTSCIACRTTDCACSACLQYEEYKLSERERRVDTDFPEPPRMQI
ncbi:F-box protein [Legionella israelensis]|uniref:F-box domain-containing protein n=1 Tax=Legionella israelensis TaxID=454 RepID=A0A0W0WNW9_9GAMM|nr:F-box protein [Legionella israelensis]KTD34026.1 hypothetical protein Lisr_0204 [Legionella israelensis]QBS10640.1 hypothetical protein E4T55_12795 [Legionella israelensis]SCX84804.1 hypothetical protein SAMN02746069_00427 [Legionella israelensis DSM 19235]STX57593.1 Uncharacterised protein [Legionella israelensis]